MNFINHIIESVNSSIAVNICYPETCIHGLTNLIEKDGKKFPMENQGKEGEKIAFDDRKPFQLYHRLIDIRKDEDETGVGDRVYERFTATMRLFGIGNKDYFKTTCHDNNLDFLMHTDAAINRKPVLNLSGLSNIRIRITGNSVNYQTIIESEFEGYDLKKLNPLKVIAFAIDYQITGLVCETDCAVAVIS